MSLDQEDITKTSDNSPLFYHKTYSEKETFSDIGKTPKSKEKLIDTISKIIEEIVEDNRLNEKKNSDLNKNCFYMEKLPKFKFNDYLKRINKYLKPEKSTLIIALIYVDKISSENSSRILLIENNILKLFMIAIMIAIKYNQDYYDDNNYIAKVGGISLNEINNLEKEFCCLIDFRLFVPLDIYQKYEEYLLD